MASSELFQTIPGFCSSCGSILPLLKEVGGVTCFTCSKEYPASVFHGTKVEYTINFNSLDAYTKQSKDEKLKKLEDEDEGPTVDRKCQKCGNEKMSYATLQLRSADEGQTVFYTCTKCNYKESENS